MMTEFLFLIELSQKDRQGTLLECCQTLLLEICDFQLIVQKDGGNGL